MARTLSIAIIAEDLASKTFDKVAASADATGASLTKAQQNANKFMSSVTKTTLLASAAVVVGSVKMAADFQKQMTLLQTAAGETQANMKIVSNGILDLAVSTGTSTTQLADGMYTVEKAGYQGAAGLLVLKAAAEGAKAENVDLSTATNALTSVMMSYHVSASKAVSVENELVAGSGKAKTSMQEYAGSLSTVIPIASAAGINFAQVAGAIATLTQHGTSAEESTQELANTIRNLQAPSSVAIKAMQQVGINVIDLETHLGSRGLTGTIQLITNAIATKLGPQGTVLVNTMMQSQTGAQDLTLMLAKMPPALQKVSKEFENGKIGMTAYRADFRGMGASGSAMGGQFMALAQQVSGYNAQIKAGGPAAQTAAGELKQIMGGATGLNTALMLGGANMKTFTADTNAVAAAGAKSGTNISTWAKTQATLAVQLDKAKEMVEVLGIRIGTDLIPVVTSVTKALTSHKDVVMDVILAIAAFGAAVTVANIAFKVWTLTTKVATGIQVGYKLATAGSTAVTEAQTAIVKKSAIAWVLSKISMVAVTVATKAYAAAQWLLNAAIEANPITLIVLGLIALGAAVYEAYEHSKTFRDIVNDIGGALKKVWTDALAPVVNFLEHNWETALEIAAAVCLPFIGIPLLIYKYWGDIESFFIGLWHDVLGVFQDVLSFMEGPWGTGILAAVAVFMPFVAIPALIALHWKTFKNDVLDALKFLIELPKTIYDYVVSQGGLIGIGKKIMLALVQGIKGAAGFLKNAAITLVLDFLNGVESSWTTVKNFFVAAPGVIGGWLKTAATWLLSSGESVINGLGRGITTGAVAVWNFFVALPGKLISYAVTADTWLLKMGKDAITGAAKGIATGAVNVWNFFTGLPLKLITYGNDADTWLVQMGKDIVMGIINGIEAMAKDLGGALKNLVMGALHGLGKLASGAAKFIGLDTGGLVPGAIGAPIPAIVHGGEFMLSRGMLTGQQTIDPSVVQAVLANISKDRAGMATMSAEAQYNAASAGISGVSSRYGNAGKQISITQYITGQSDPVGTANASSRRIVAAVI